MKKSKSTRDVSERKDRVTSIRCSDDQFKKIQNNAKEARMSFNNFLVTVGANGKGTVTPELMVEIQDAINYACAVVKDKAPEEVGNMQERTNKIWQKWM